jgi:hypothetical protein
MVQRQATKPLAVAAVQQPLVLLRLQRLVAQVARVMT